MDSYESGSDVVVKPTKTQSKGTLLATIGVPLAPEVIKGITGKGAPRMGRARGKGAPRMGLARGKGAPRMGIYTPSPPFFGQWPDDKVGMGAKKKLAEPKARERRRTSPGSKQPVQQHSGSRSVFVKPKFVNKPLSNFDSP